jgi:hypothetical protein
MKTTEIFYKDLQPLYEEYVENLKLINKKLKEYESLFSNYRSPDSNNREYLKKRNSLTHTIYHLRQIKIDFQYVIKWMQLGYDPKAWLKSYGKTSRANKVVIK